MMLILKALGEFGGTFSMIFVGGGAVYIAEKYPSIFPSFGVALTFGSIIALMILVFGTLSGAHFNPAVTLAFTLMKRFPPALIPVYWLSQFLGGLTAAVLLLLLVKKL